MQIFGFHYKVIFCPTLDGLAETGGASGNADFHRKEIKIWTAPCRNAEAIQHTFLHELIHVIQDEMGLPEMSDDDVDRWALGWGAFFRENGIKVPVR